MRLLGLLALAAETQEFREIAVTVADGGEADIIAPAGVRPLVVAELAKKRTVLAVTATGREADELAAALRCYLPEGDVAVLPAWETLPHERLSPRSDTVATRLAVFRRLVHPETDGLAGPIRVLVAPTRALLQPIVAGLAELVPVSARTGDEIDMERLVEDLVAAAYTRVDMVERRGEFAVRGGIVDVFPPTEDHPLRLEFFGDEVDEIRYFAVADQRSLEVAAHGLWAPPCRELLLDDGVRERARDLADRVPAAQEMLEKLAQGIAVEGMESLTPALVDEMVPVLSLVPREAVIVACDPERVRRRAADLVATTDEFLAAAWSGAAAGGQVPIDLSAASFLNLEQVREVAGEREQPWWTIGPFGVDATDPAAALDYATDSATEGSSSDRGRIRIAARELATFHGDVAKALGTIHEHQQQGWRLVATTQGPGPAKRMVEQLAEAGTPARLVDEVADAPEPGVVHVVPALAGTGFASEEHRLAVFSEADITGRAVAGTRDMSRLAARRRGVVDPLQLKVGDFVVHEQHGVGRYVELVQRTAGKGEAATTREYLVIEYAPSRRGQPGDRLFVPTDKLDQITRYVGGEAPSLSKMGGADWTKTKARARKHVKEIASELIRLYSARMATKGFSFSPDTPWQRELEDAFPYIETPDQLVTIDEVKADMEKAVPMDRLICGDVGYGKTEVAVRAAFKAVQDGRQVAVLVPTTLLAQQHFETFTERYAGFPIQVRTLSRFQTEKESKAVMDGLADGTVDVVIGTHRLLTGSVQFKSLGLVIVDEEQRFGVEHKETLKALRTNVDVLAMSATPIPRTLEMAVTGIREMSTLATPPEERHPVLTYVGAYEDKQIAAAVRRELLREGQIFYVHNRVESIDRAASRIASLVPEARIAVAHGKMSEKQLDHVIRDFWEKKFDVLVCTTIVETGLDISNANTLIVERADLFGLSQLHQLRGRVGRGRERAYAYFLYPPEKPLTETAHDRLATIAANTDLGAGMQIAMKDLEIRGAGNLLGGEQSGHIEGVGFDLYVRMVGEAVQAFRGEGEDEAPEVTVELPIDAHIPHQYIDGERLRLEAYRKLAEVTAPGALDEIRAELQDRYGALPLPVENLFAVAEFRLLARQYGLAEVVVQGNFVRLAHVELPESSGLRLKRLYPGSIIKPAVRTLLVPYPKPKRMGAPPIVGLPLLEWARELIAAIVPVNR
ncbi:transcription-repair coupling factor [Rarobacter faecitabidus]|uniref:Transcription-repair-coupling factor n=1 Tax=Rarobacter faecitabidus TaxID=13243 RepID=A0A542ZTY2_RARFA|nr:transcription-repair coupling factor [Rarobacter faecitabidus]TQL63815.1 transcription-repair coupling factor [Rarobacter faecitabidus]